ncbi:unnamed protein product [Caenorhabditis bovis]|uniref:THUMP domain-containing protein n=1 Tax=Caenorhabditis bovis TaxID=2654633 RepID=A0A8S1F0D2_9PELO|nr:unnamed protein product [Caenorhabditis bovis]
MTDIEVYSTIVTGFEGIGASEVSRKIPNAKNVAAGRGFVRFAVEPENLSKIEDLRSVDNLFVVIYENTIIGLREMQKEEAIATIKDQISFMNWKNAIEAWQIAHKRPIYGGSQKIVEQMRKFMKDGTPSEVSETSPSFRVTCKRAGDKSVHQFSSMDAAWHFGAHINNVFGWKVDMKKFDIEVYLRIEKDSVSVMMALNGESMFKRNIVAYGPTTMRSTVCYCMTALADPKPGEIVVDTMCGGGSIPIEGAHAFRGVAFFGGDNHPLALQRCHSNWKENELNGAFCDFFLWSAVCLPLKSNSIDAIITDMPFGKKLGSVMDNRILYPKLLEEWKRVLRIGGRLVLLTHDRRSIDAAILKDRENWRTDSTHMVNMGGLTCLCIRLTNIKCE